MVPGFRFGSFVFVLAALLGIVSTALTPAFALDSGKPGDILQVSFDGPGSAEDRLFDLQALQDIGTESFVTTTIWTDGPHEFTGVPLYALMQHLGITDQEIRAYALNDYSVLIPASDARPGGPILAFSQDGAPIPRRLKGPLWIVYPYDSSPEFRSEKIYARSIWQLNRLVISN